MHHYSRNSLYWSVRRVRSLDYLEKTWKSKLAFVNNDISKIKLVYPYAMGATSFISYSGERLDLVFDIKLIYLHGNLNVQIDSKFNALLH